MEGVGLWDGGMKENASKNFETPEHTCNNHLCYLIVRIMYIYIFILHIPQIGNINIYILNCKSISIIDLFPPSSFPDSYSYLL